jgi:hypothetical protein
MSTDYAAWKPLAERTREALELLGYGVPRCLPGEPEACGGDYAHHSLAHLAALKAVVEQRITHLGNSSAPLVEEICAKVSAELSADDFPCDQGH